MTIKLVEDIFNSEHTKNEKEEARIQVKINKYGSKDDEDAFRMIEYLKNNNINVSKHIRYLLALEYQGALTQTASPVKALFNNSDDIVESNESESDNSIDIGLEFEQEHGEIGSEDEINWG